MSCPNTYDLGCFGVCDTLILPFTVSYTGQYRIEYRNTYGAVESRTVSLLTGSNITLEGAWFMPGSTATVMVYDPNGNILSHTDESCVGTCTQYYKYQVKTEVRNVVMAPYNPKTLVGCPDECFTNDC